MSNPKSNFILEHYRAMSPAPSLVVEVGCVRFDQEFPSEGYSTVYLAGEARKTGARFVTIDLANIEVAERVLANHRLTAEFVEANAEEVIASIGSIDFLYIDIGDTRAIKAILEAAKFSGRGVFVVDDCQGPLGEGLHAAAKAAGFEFTTTEVWGEYSMGVGRRPAPRRARSAASSEEPKQEPVASE